MTPSLDSTPTTALVVEPRRPHHPLTQRLIDEMRTRGFVTVREAATLSRTPLPTIYSWVRDGSLAYETSGKRRLFIALDSLQHMVAPSLATEEESTPALPPRRTFPRAVPPRLDTPSRSGRTRKGGTHRTLEDMHARGFVTPTEAASLSSTPLPTIYSWVRSRSLDCETADNGRVFISVPSLRRMIAPSLVEQWHLFDQLRTLGWIDDAPREATRPLPVSMASLRRMLAPSLAAREHDPGHGSSEVA